MVENKVMKKIIKKIAPKKVLAMKKIVTKPVVSKKIISKSVVQKKIIPKRIEKIEVKNVQDILKIVGNKDYFEIYNLIFKMDKDFFNRGFSGSFDTNKGIKDFFKERIFDFLKGVYADLKSRISQLRKKGKKVMYIDYEVLMMPLKMKMLKANFTLNDFLKVKEIIDFAEKELKEFKIED